MRYAPGCCAACFFVLGPHTALARIQIKSRHRKTLRPAHRKGALRSADPAHSKHSQAPGHSPNTRRLSNHVPKPTDRNPNPNSCACMQPTSSGRLILIPRYRRSSNPQQIITQFYYVPLPRQSRSKNPFQFGVFRSTLPSVESLTKFAHTLYGSAAGRPLTLSSAATVTC
jgi:hypothetical protein